MTLTVLLLAFILVQVFAGYKASRDASAAEAGRIGYQSRSMMMGGISLIGAVTATVAAWFTERVRGPEDLAERQLIEEVGRLQEEIAPLRAHVQGEDVAGRG